MQGYGDNPLQQALMRIQALDNDNVQLRNKLIATNEENFNLQAAIMVCEAESNYKAEQDLGQLKSQLGFKDKELQDLNSEYKRLLKEVNQLRSKQPADAKRSDDLASVSSDHSSKPSARAPLPPTSPVHAAVPVIVPQAQPTSGYPDIAHNLIMVSDIVEIFHEILFQHQSMQTTVCPEPSAATSQQSPPPSVRTAHTYTRTAQVFTQHLADSLQTTADRLRCLPSDDLVALFMKISSQCSQLVAEVAMHRVWSTDALLSAAVQLCALLYETDGNKWEDEAFCKLFLLSLRLLAAVVCRLLVKELSMRPAPPARPNAEVNLTDRFNAMAAPSNHHSYQSYRSLIKQAIKLPPGHQAAVTNDPTPLDADQLTASMRTLMEFLSSLRGVFHFIHLALVFDTTTAPYAFKPKVLAITNELLLMLSALTSLQICAGYQMVILGAACSLLGGADADSKPGLIWEMLMHPELPVEDKIQLVVLAKRTVTQADRGFAHFLRCQFFPRSEEKKDKKRKAELERPLSALHILLSDLSAGAHAMVPDHVQCREEVEAMKARLQYKLEIAICLLDMLRCGGELCIAALLGVDPNATIDLVESNKAMEVDDEDQRPAPSKRKRKVSRLTGDSDEDEEEAKTAAPAHPSADGFHLSILPSNPQLMNKLDCTMMNVIYTVWAHSWRALDHIPVMSNQSARPYDTQVRIQLCLQLTCLVNELVAGLTAVSAGFCKFVLRDCLGHVDAFMCRYCTSSLFTGLSLTDAHVCHLESLAQ